jgi:hypothetical protein
MGKKSEFVRTPKLNIEELKDKWKQNTYLSQTISKNIIIEGILILYFILQCIVLLLNDYSLIALHLMLFIGFSFVFVKSIQINKSSNS